MWKKTSTAALAISVLLLLASSSSGDVPSYEDTFGFRNGDGVEYEAFLNQFDAHVKITAGEWIDDLHPVLGEQKLTTTPDAWLRLVFKETGTDDRLTLVIRSDNLYVSGFVNKYGECFAFLGERRKLPGSTQLSYASGYPDLFDEKKPGSDRKLGYEGLKTLPINKVQAAGHFRTLANYRAGAGTDKALKKPLAFFVLTISEAERFTQIREAVADAWDNPEAQTIPGSVIDQVMNWARISCALRAWDKYGRTQASWAGNVEAEELNERLQIASPDQALDVVGPLLRGRKCSWTPLPPPST